MKRIKTFIYLFITAASLTGCKKFIDVNTNPNTISAASEALILSPVEEGMSSYVCGGYNAILVNYWMQNMTLNQAVPNDVTYVVTNNSFDGPWYNFYVICMNNLYQLNLIAMTNGNSMYAGIAKTLMAYTLGSATDLWGDIPYSEAFQGTDVTTASYDSQESIYSSISTLLDSAITQLNSGEGTSPGSDDFFYSGDMASWLKLAYSLKARYIMHLTKADGYSAATQASLALTALENGMTDYSDDCYFPYSGETTASAPWYWNFYNTTTAIMASTYVDSLKARSDPRIGILLTEATNTGLYTGSVIGSGFTDLNDYSVAGSFYGDAASNGYVFNADEALFLKAEATYYVSGYAAASIIYREAIIDNMLKLGVDTTSSAAQSYLTARGTLTASNALQRIMEEKAVANFFSMENWVDWRRTGYPSLTVISTANGAPSSVTEIPRRFLYPENEVTSNPQSVQSAAITDRVWWDTQ
ncbi:SusD/RagB family nutrient-binding outer membrane lipoprotein [Parafilimonas sp.]|uniref:SusD/RagB family nutrient-binding outer membrane lipoprotein n=1 Tax=Parafilimonas sp. TaxID=1969739 RepID=UPI0039E6ADA2